MQNIKSNIAMSHSYVGLITIPEDPDQCKYLIQGGGK